MPYVLFDLINSETDLGLFLSDVQITEPEPKRTLVDVPVMDGELDLTYALSSEIHYKNRKLTLEFKTVDYTNNWMSVFSDIADKLHGKKMRVVISNDPDWYWDAFVTVDPSSKYNEGTIKVNLNAYPYKQKDDNKTIYVISAGTSISVSVVKQTVIPTIITSKSIAIVVDGGTEYSLAAGTHVDPGFKLAAGNHTLLISGNNVSVRLLMTQGRL